MANKANKKALVYPIKINNDAGEILPSNDPELLAIFSEICEKGHELGIGNKFQWLELSENLKSGDVYGRFKSMCEIYTLYNKFKRKFSENCAEYEEQVLSSGPGVFYLGLITKAQRRTQKLLDSGKIKKKEADKYFAKCKSMSQALSQKVPSHVSVNEFLDTYHGTEIGPNMRIYFMQNRGCSATDLVCGDKDPKFIDEHTDLQLTGVHGGITGGIDSNKKGATQSRQSIVSGLNQYFDTLKVDPSKMQVTAEWCNPEIDHGYLDAQYISMKTGACLKGYHAAIEIYGYNNHYGRKMCVPHNGFLMIRSTQGIKRVFISGHEFSGALSNKELKSFHQTWMNNKHVYLDGLKLSKKRSAPSPDRSAKLGKTENNHDNNVDIERRKKIVLKQQRKGHGGRGKPYEAAFDDEQNKPVASGIFQPDYKRQFKPLESQCESSTYYQAKKELKKQRKRDSKERTIERSRLYDAKF